MMGRGFRALAMIVLKEQLQYRREVVDRQLAHVQKNKTDSAIRQSSSPAGVSQNDAGLVGSFGQHLDWSAARCAGWTWAQVPGASLVNPLPGCAATL